MTQHALMTHTDPAKLNNVPNINGADSEMIQGNAVVSPPEHVATHGQKLAAETGTRRVNGVTTIAEDTEYRLTFDAKDGDEHIAAMTFRNLAADGPEAAMKKSSKGEEVACARAVRGRLKPARVGMLRPSTMPKAIVSGGG